MSAAQLSFTDATPPPTARWDWQSKRDHTPPHYRVGVGCPHCHQTVVAKWTPGHWWICGNCKQAWQERVWTW